jgi:hypothetical protein
MFGRVEMVWTEEFVQFKVTYKLLNHKFNLTPKEAKT